MVDDPGGSMHGRLGFLVYRLHLALREAFEERLAADGISCGDWGVLAHVREGVNTPAKLADCLGVNRGAVTHTLHRLEAAGLATRSPNTADRRSSLVTLTAAGEQVTARAAAASEEINAAYTAGLTESERGQLMELLGKTVRTLPGRRRSSDGCPDG